MHQAISNGPKCLAKVGGRSLIEHQLSLFESAGVKRIAVVIGYAGAKVREAVAGRADIIHNPAWDKTEGLYSLHLCRDWITGPLLVLNCDVLLHPAALERLLESGPNSLVFDSSSGRDAEQMAVEFDGEYLATMSKNLPFDRTHGENVGVLYFDFASSAPFIARGRSDGTVWRAQSAFTFGAAGRALHSLSRHRRRRSVLDRN
ncbi:MAG: NTP transferase domain-containing protein [Burkholderiales bacterium]